MRERPSSTARVIAAATVLVASDPTTRGLVDTEAARLSRVMLSTTWTDRFLRTFVSSHVGRWLWKGRERFVLPGISRHFALRKRWIESRWRAARKEGFTQLLVLGGGLDTLAVRVAAESGDDVRIIEVDHPASQYAKLRALQGEPGIERVRFMPAKLEEAATVELLSREGVIDPARATFVVMEGLAMYLPRERVRALLREVNRLGVPRVRIAWTFVETGELKSVWFARGGVLLKWWLKLVGEPFASTLQQDEIKGLLSECGLRLVEISGPCELAGMRQGKKKSRGPVGDWVVLADGRSAEA